MTTNAKVVRKKAKNRPYLQSCTLERKNYYCYKCNKLTNSEILLVSSRPERIELWQYQKWGFMHKGAVQKKYYTHSLDPFVRCIRVFLCSLCSCVCCICCVLVFVVFLCSLCSCVRCTVGVTLGLCDCFQYYMKITLAGWRPAKNLYIFTTWNSAHIGSMKFSQTICFIFYGTKYYYE